MVVGADGAVAVLDATGVPISVLDEATFEERCVSLGEGARVFLFSDGCFEERDPERRQFGIERLVDALRESPERSLATVLDDTIEAVQRWRGRDRLSDDVALLGLEIGQGHATR